jgi:signal transduction histidine kinase
MDSILKIFQTKNSIISKIIKNLFIFLTLFLLAIVSINYYLTKKNYDKIEQEKIDIILNSIESTLAVNISFEFDDAVDETLNNLVQNKDIILVKLETLRDNKEKKFFNKSRKTANINTNNSFSKTIEIVDPHTKETIANLTLIYSKDHFYELINEYYQWMGLIVLIYSIASIFFIRLVSTLIKPLDNIAHKMGNFDPSNPQKIENNSDNKDEISMICESSNMMIDTIDKYINEMETKNNLIFEQSKMASMGEMIGNIAHQWRQPLSIISTGATGMKMQKQFDALSDENFNKTCDVINENAQYLSRTIDDFRNFIKGERKKVVFNLNNAIDSFINLVQGPIKNNNIEVVFDLEKDLSIYGYENELIQCLINIFNNSKDVLKDMDVKDKYIFISTKSNNEHALIIIKDNAGGIADAILPKIFEPYFTTKHKSQGTGLGLHMTYKLITEGMSGSVIGKNAKYDYNGQDFKGAEFIISLPIK